MTNVKQQVAQILDQLPNDCAIEDVQYQLYVLETIRRRIELTDEGKFVPQSEAERRMAKWILK